MATAQVWAGRVLAAGLILGLSRMAAAQGPETAARSTAADGKLKEVAAAYQKLSAYADRGELVLTYHLNGKETSFRLPVPLRFVRSEGMFWDATETGIAADRTQVTFVRPAQPANLPSIPPFFFYVGAEFLGRTDALLRFQTRLRLGTADPERYQLLVMGGPRLLEVLATLMLYADGARRITAIYESVWDEPDRVIDGNPAQVVVMQRLRDEPPFRAFIDPGTKLLRRLEMPLPKGDDEKGDDLGDATLSWSSGDVVTERDRVKQELEPAKRAFLARTVDALPPIAPQAPPPVVTSNSLPPVPSKVMPSPQVEPAPQAPAKAAPGSMLNPGLLNDPDGAVPLVAMSLLFVQGSQQTPVPNELVSSDSILHRLLCRIIPCRKKKPAVLP